ncbi:group II truncated hemoglobin [Caulobacter sp.]|jgi:hemoglobin|uniref:group II truncated hemoglobin n=1 Tax=Caulobacter sp. TaxID=78 RepID=UPI0031DC0333
MSVDTQDTAFDQIGGAARIDVLVEAFYDFIETDPAYAELRAMHAADMTPVRASLKGWLTGWLGGSRDWFAQHPGVCMMSMHRAMPIDAATAGQWTDAMKRALAQVEVDADLAEALNEVFGRMASGMRAH